MFIWSCEPFITQFEDSEDAVHYTASSNTPAAINPLQLNVMTWNIRFGVGRLPWFGDSCGDNVIVQKSAVIDTLIEIVNFINGEDPDIILLQEVDVSSKRTGYIDQVQWLLNHTDFNYAVYASMWQADFIPSDGLGKVDAGNAILSKWPIENAERIQLPLRGDQDGLTQYFYLRRNILKSKININDEKGIYALCTHTTAFATDDTKQKHIDKFYDVLASIDEDNDIFVAGGDLNALSSDYAEDERDFCEVDRGADDVCDDDYNNNEIYQGSYFNHLVGEEGLLDSLYKFNSAIIETESNIPENYTHSTWISSEDYIDTNNDDLHQGGDDGPLNRKLDYIFSSDPLINGITHQAPFYLSDHAPVSATLLLP